MQRTIKLYSILYKLLEAMNLDVLLLAHGPFHEQLGNFLPVIPLQLNNVLAVLLVLDDTPIASKVLLEDLEDLLRVNVLGQAFNGGQGFAAIALVQANV